MHNSQFFLGQSHCGSITQVRAFLVQFLKIMDTITLVNDELNVIIQVSVLFAAFHVRSAVFLANYVYNFIAIAIELALRITKRENVATIIQVDLKWILVDFGEFLRNAVYIDLKIFSSSILRILRILADICNTQSILFDPSMYMTYFVNGTGTC